MEKACERLDICGFFKNFRDNAEVVERAWITMYCLMKETSDMCERKKAFKETGESPPDNLAPTGKFI